MLRVSGVFVVLALAGCTSFNIGLLRGEVTKIKSFQDNMSSFSEFEIYLQETSNNSQSIYKKLFPNNVTNKCAIADTVEINYTDKRIKAVAEIFSLFKAVAKLYDETIDDTDLKLDELVGPLEAAGNYLGAGKVEIGIAGDFLKLLDQINQSVSEEIARRRAKAFFATKHDRIKRLSEGLINSLSSADKTISGHFQQWAVCETERLDELTRNAFGDTTAQILVAESWLAYHREERAAREKLTLQKQIPGVIIAGLKDLPSDIAKITSPDPKDFQAYYQKLDSLITASRELADKIDKAG